MSPSSVAKVIASPIEASSRKVESGSLRARRRRPERNSPIQTTTGLRRRARPERTWAFGGRELPLAAAGGTPAAGAGWEPSTPGSSEAPLAPPGSGVIGLSGSSVIWGSGGEDGESALARAAVVAETSRRAGGAARSSRRRTATDAWPPGERPPASHGKMTKATPFTKTTHDPARVPGGPSQNLHNRRPESVHKNETPLAPVLDTLAAGHPVSRANRIDQQADLFSWRRPPRDAVDASTSRQSKEHPPCASTAPCWFP